MRAMAFSKGLLLPLLVLLLVNLVAFVWRSGPPPGRPSSADADWHIPSPSASLEDLRPGILVGSHWGEVARADGPAVTEDAAEAGEQGFSSAVRALNQRIQRQLQGIVHRGDWVLLFARAGALETGAEADHRPLELGSGDQLPDTPWQIGEIWPDRIQLVQPGHESLIVPLYPLAEPETEQ